MTLQTYSVPGLDPKWLEGQESAFEKCLSFLAGVDKTEGQNSRTSYGLKHIVEHPGRLCGLDLSAPERLYNGYVYEGTLILAALASGFRMRQRGKHMKVTFNISEPSLKNRCREYVERSGKFGA